MSERQYRRHVVAVVAVAMGVVAVAMAVAVVAVAVEKKTSVLLIIL